MIIPTQAADCRTVHCMPSRRASTIATTAFPAGWTGENDGQSSWDSLEGGLKLAELGEMCGGLDYRTVGIAVTKAIARVGKHREFQKADTSVQKRLTVN